ncbi:hypothetical protein E2562_034971 [Oryza meyeriana var. granulata]|uniref:Uncharacterized protein n=1 Tax=Oryza meyeriana var. granulata TaxID=110450 RepID=A0A6G1BQG2_9ORYZ|nr:hypothetical protein E2562_034971 [Oryza meyeriana var. granulata]
MEKANAAHPQAMDMMAQHAQVFWSNNKKITLLLHMLVMLAMLDTWLVHGLERWKMKKRKLAKRSLKLILNLQVMHMTIENGAMVMHEMRYIFRKDGSTQGNHFF